MLAAATSIATKVNEESLTYLNQGQPYEIKMKKLGDLSNFRGKQLRVTNLFLHSIQFNSFQSKWLFIFRSFVECGSIMLSREKTPVHGT